MTKPEPGYCPACKHAKHLHMKNKHRSWTLLERADAACTCGCGVTREEIVDYHKKHPPQIHVPGLRGHGVKTSKIRAVVAVPQHGDGAIFLNWSEEDNDILSTEMEALGTPLIEEYGLGDPPGFGVWIFEGELKAVWSRCGNPLDPPDYDLDIEWTGEWRQPTNEELAGVRGFKPTLIKKVGPE